VFLPIDTSGMSFTAAAAPRQVLDFETKAPRATSNGEPIYAVRVFADLLGDVIAVKVAGEPAGVGRGTQLTITGLTAISWELEGRKGLSFRAEHIEPAASAVRRAAS
jgi:hypothetical protein